MYIVVARRVMPMDMENSHWTWTLYKLGPTPLCRAEDSWNTPETARRNAYKFCKEMGLKIKVKMSGAAVDLIKKKRKP